MTPLLSQFGFGGKEEMIDRKATTTKDGSHVTCGSGGCHALPLSENSQPMGLLPYNPWLHQFHWMHLDLF